MTRVSKAELLRLAESMPDRERQIIEAVDQFRLLSGSQLGRLYFHTTIQAASRERVSRRVLHGLAAQHVLVPLERRIGGVRAGSAGTVYSLGPIGKRLIAYWHGDGLVRVRTVHQPGVLFVRHTLAVAECYVQLVEAARDGWAELLAFDAEPTCWRSFVGSYGGETILKPDAFIRLGVDGGYEQRTFLELDCGSEGRGALMRKCRAYAAYYRSGQETVMPRVVWITTAQARVRLLVDICARLPAEDWQLFAIGTTDRLLSLCLGDEQAPKSAVI